MENVHKHFLPSYQEKYDRLSEIEQQMGGSKLNWEEIKKLQYQGLILLISELEKRI